MVTSTGVATNAEAEEGRGYETAGCCNEKKDALDEVPEVIGPRSRPSSIAEAVQFHARSAFPTGKIVRGDCRRPCRVAY